MRHIDGFVHRRDYVAHDVSPIKQRLPDKYVKKDETMDLLSTYKQDYNPHPINRVHPCLPQERQCSSDKMTTIPTYKSKCPMSCFMRRSASLFYFYS